MGIRLTRAAFVAALLALAGGCGQEPPPAAGPPPIVLVTLDTTRADRLGVYGYTRDTSPHLDAMARESVVYTRAYAPSSWTLPSHASLFTGKLTSSHGARYDPQGPLHLADALDGRPGLAGYRARGLSPQERTLAAMLADAGYATGAVVAGPWMKRVFGLDTGFDHYDDREIEHLAGRPGDRVTEAALAWLDGLEGPQQRRFFLFLNYFDAHAPYFPPLEFLHALDPDAERLAGKLRGAQLQLQYDAGVRAADHYLGRLLEGLRERGLYEDAWILVTSDHGDLLGEHGRYGHGKTLLEAEIRVPLVVKPPGGAQAPRRVDTPVSLVDLMPWIATRLGLALPAGVQGDALPEPRRPLVAETYPLAAYSDAGHWRALIEVPHKFQWSSRGEHVLVDLERDPEERVNLLGEMPERADAMERRLQQYLASLPPPGEAAPGEVDEETRRALESLGYVE